MEHLVAGEVGEGRVGHEIAVLVSAAAVAATEEERVVAETASEIWKRLARQGKNSETQADGTCLTARFLSILNGSY